MQAFTLGLNSCVLPIRVVAVYVGLPFSQTGDNLLRRRASARKATTAATGSTPWTGQSNGLGRGLPPAEKNEGHSALYRPPLGNAALRPTPADIERTSDHYREMLRVRYSSSLFRLPSAAEVQKV